MASSEQKQKKKDESKQKRKERRKRARNAIGSFFKKLPKPAKIALAIAAIVLIVVTAGVVLPLALDRDETQHLTETSLKDAVNIESLAAIDYTYQGIAEKPGKILWMDTVDYRVRYEAHIRASYNMTEIQFAIDEENMLITAYLPEAEISTPVLDDSKFGFLPEDATADMADVLALCKEDAANELSQDEMKKEANANLQDIVEALTIPLLGDEWTLEFKDLAEYPSEEEASNESE